MSRQSFKQSLLILCPVSSYLKGLLKKLKHTSRNFGGGIEVSKGSYIGLVRRKCVGPKVR